MGSLIKTQTASKTSKPNKTPSLPVGYEDFEEVRTEGLYYVDKTGLVQQLFENRSKVTLFTRPRRFGKTLNMSMLEHFFEIGSDPSLFDGLEIMQRQDLCKQHMGQYPVIFLTLKDVARDSFAKSFARFKDIVVDEIKRHNYLSNSEVLSADEKSDYAALRSANFNKADFAYVLTKLCTLLEKHHGKKTVILIDEYDVPLDKAYINGYYDEMIDLIRAMFSAAFKTNTSLQLAVLTGCLRVSKESVFTGLNNFRVCGISDLKYTECFGFTESEVKEMLEYYGVSDRLQDAKAWYDGYMFGTQEIYCPWDVINFCYTLRSCPTAQPTAYWINTSGNDLIKRLIERSNSGTVRAEIESLINGSTIEKNLNLNITHREIEEDINNLWSLLFMTGYLTTAEQPKLGPYGFSYKLRIPNFEIKLIYRQQVMNWFSEAMNSEARAKSKQIQQLFKAFEQADAQTLEELLNRRLLTTISFMDAHENFYHGFLLALLEACPSWAVRSNTEGGYGRSDIMVQNEDYSFVAIVEIKSLRAGNFDKLEQSCAQALEQIDKKRYTAQFEMYGINPPITKYGIAFCGKRCKVVCDAP